jgi:hypothetical protein
LAVELVEDLDDVVDTLHVRKPDGLLDELHHWTIRLSQLDGRPGAAAKVGGEGTGCENLSAEAPAFSANGDEPGHLWALDPSTNLDLDTVHIGQAGEIGWEDVALDGSPDLLAVGKDDRDVMVLTHG